jgi:hypothetical protein
MTNVLAKAAHKEDLTVRGLRQSDLPAADSILRSAFDTFTGVTSLFGDKDYVHTRWLADPSGAFAAERDGRLVGTNFVTGWGTVGFFGPLAVRPELCVELGVNASRHEAYAALAARGYRAGLVGVSMHQANDEGYSRPGVWLIDDWR